MDVTLYHHDGKFLPLPEGLKELSSDITREVLRSQPTEIYRFVSEYLNAVLITREKAREAAAIVRDILIHDVTYEAMLKRRGISMEVANRAATIIQAAYRGYAARKLYAGRTWLITGFDLVAYLKALGLDFETASCYATKIQSLYRGHVVRRILRDTFNFAVARDTNAGQELASYLSDQGLEEEEVCGIVDHVLSKYGEMAAEYTTEEETVTGTDTETETETDTDTTDAERGGKSFSVDTETEIVAQSSRQDEDSLVEGGLKPTDTSSMPTVGSTQVIDDSKAEEGKAEEEVQEEAPEVAASEPVEEELTPKAPSDEAPEVAASEPVEEEPTPKAPSDEAPEVAASEPVEEEPTPKAPSDEAPEVAASEPVEEEPTPKAPSDEAQEVAASEPVEEESTPKSPTDEAGLPAEEEPAE